MYADGYNSTRLSSVKEGFFATEVRAFRNAATVEVAIVQEDTVRRVQMRVRVTLGHRRREPQAFIQVLGTGCSGTARPRSDRLVQQCGGRDQGTKLHDDDGRDPGDKVER